MIEAYELNRIPEIKNLKNASRRFGAAFGAFCAERSLPFYEIFSTRTNWGDPSTLRKAINEIWNFAEGGVTDSTYLEGLLPSIYELIPDSEDFVDDFTGMAISASAIVCYSLEYCRDGDSSKLESVSTLSFEIVRTYLHLVNNPYPEAVIESKELFAFVENAPLMDEERRSEQMVIAAIRGPNAEAELAQIRAASVNSGIRPKMRYFGS